MKLKTYLEKLSNKTEVCGFAVDSLATSGKPLTQSPNYLRSLNEQDSDERKRILIDFDGVIHRYSKGFYNGTIYDRPNLGCREFIKYLQKKGFSVVIFTSRIDKHNNANYLEQIKNLKVWLRKYKIPYDGITSKKLTAVAYVDDRGINYHNNNWKEIITRIKELDDEEL